MHGNNSICERLNIITLMLLFIISFSLPIAAYGKSEDRQKISAQLEKADNLYLKSRPALDNGDFMDAISSLEDAVQIYRLENEPAKQIDTLTRLASSYQALGQYVRAFDRLQTAWELTRKYNDRIRLAVILGGLGRHYYLLGELSVSKDYFDKGLALANEADSPSIAADILLDVGNLYAAQQNYVEAIDAYTESINQSRKSGKSDVSVRATVNLARVYLEQKKYIESANYLTTAFKETESLKDTHDKAYDLIAIGKLFQRIYQEFETTDQGMVKNAYEAFRTAEKVARGLTNQRALSYSLGSLADFYEMGKRYEDALVLTQGAIMAAQQANAFESLYRWHWQKGRILKISGDMNGAIASYRLAVESLRSIRQDVSAACIRRANLSFRETVGPVYFELADLLLQRSASQKDAELIKKDLIEARNTIEHLKSFELQDYFQDDCVVALKTKEKNLDQIIQQTAVVYFIPLSSRTELLVSLPSGLKQFTVPVGIGDLNKEVIAFRNELQQPASLFLSRAQKLYNWLIRPMEKVLKVEQIDTLIFVPDGMLRTIPMTALHDGDQYVIDKYAVVTTPGLTLMDPQPLTREHPKALVSGITEAVQGFPPLPSVAAELQAIKNIYDGSLLQDKAFTVPGLEGAMKSTSYTTLHIASHGQFDRNPQKTFLLTYNEKLSMDRLEKLIGLSRFRDKPVELLTLSACQTAVGDDRAALGLAGVAIKAGARSAVASLWFVDDEATSQLMVEFYRQLQNPSLSKAKALQKAQQKLLATHNYRHPAYWAPFILVGNWL